VKVRSRFRRILLGALVGSATLLTARFYRPEMFSFGHFGDPLDAAFASDKKMRKVRVRFPRTAAEETELAAQALKGPQACYDWIWPDEDHSRLPQRMPEWFDGGDEGAQRKCGQVVAVARLISSTILQPKFRESSASPASLYTGREKRE
jgi:hypothetical protein